MAKKTGEKVEEMKTQATSAASAVSSALATASAQTDLATMSDADFFGDGMDLTGAGFVGIFRNAVGDRIKGRVIADHAPEKFAGKPSDPLYPKAVLFELAAPAWINFQVQGDEKPAGLSPVKHTKKGTPVYERLAEVGEVVILNVGYRTREILTKYPPGTLVGIVNAEKRETSNGNTVMVTKNYIDRSTLPAGFDPETGEIDDAASASPN